MRKAVRRLAIAIAILAVAPAYPQPTAKTAKSSKATRVQGPRFSQRDRETITKYLTSPYSNLPPGLKDGGTDVPPNVRREIVRSSVLPPELQRRTLRLPPPLEARLPKLPKPYQRAVVGPDVIIFNTKTQQISDVMRSVLIPAHSMYN
jgi:hypothetical protein